MNHFKIMVLCKKANFFMPHYFIWCRLPLVLHPLTAYPAWIARMIIARSSLHSNLACTLRGMAPTPHVVMLGSRRMWLEVNLASAGLGILGVYCKSTWNLSHSRNACFPSLSNSLLFIAMKLGQRVAQNLRIDYHLILNLWALFLSRWAFGFVWLHGNIVTHLQMSH